MTTTTSGGAADLPEAGCSKHHLIHCSQCRHDNMVRDLRAENARLTTQLAALAAGQATAAQQGVAYAALPTSSHAGRVYEEGFLIGTCPLYTADKLRAFADATCALRASHGEAPAQTADSQLLQFYGVTTDAELIAAQAAHIEKLQAKLTKTPSFAPQRVREG